MKHKLFSVMMVVCLLASLCVIMAVPSPAFANVDAPSVTPSPATAGSTAQYAVAFSPGASGTLSAGNTVSIEFPSGTTVPTAIDYRNVLVATSGTTTATNPPVAGVSVSSRTVTIQIPTGGYGVAASGTMTITFTQLCGIKNPQVSTHTGDATAYTAKVSTSRETTQVTSGAYTITDWVSASTTVLAKGQVVTLTGAGFKPGATIETPMLLASYAVNGAAMGTATVGTDGTFTMTAFGSGYANEIGVSDGTGRYAQTATVVTLLPTITVTPTSGIIGSNVVIDVMNFSSAAASGTFAAAPATYLTIAGTAMSGGTATQSDLDADGTSDDARWVGTIPQTLTGGVKTISVIDPGSSRITNATFTVTSQEIVVNPASAAPGAQVTISGTGFAPGQTGGTITGVMTASPTVASGIETDSTGAFTAVGTIPTGAATGTLGLIVSIGSTTKIGYVTVTARVITVTPTSGPKGTSVTISGGGFPYATTTNDTVASLLFRTTNWNVAAYGGGSTVSLDTQGNITPTTLTVGNFSTGVNTITVTDELTTHTATGQFTITVPTCTMEPASAVRGDTITVTGSGWLVGTMGLVQIYFNGNVITTATPDANGTIYQQFQVPSSVTANSTVAFYAKDLSNNQSVAGTMVIPAGKLEVSPTSGPVGTTITITGSGFLPSSGVTSVTMGSSGGVTLIAGQAVVTNSAGRFTVTATVPGLAVGGQAVSASAGGTTATTSFTITTGSAAAVTPATATSTVASQLVIMWTFDAATQTWKIYDPQPGATSDIASMTVGQGYWIKVSEDCTMTYGNKTYNLKAGWNLPGWLG